MTKMQVKLPSGDIRYVTNISENDFSHSIYEHSALEPTDDNIKRAKDVLNSLGLDKKVTILPKSGCFVQPNGGIRCY